MDLMTNDQYTELIGFLGGKFDGIERRLDDHDRRFEGIDRQFEETRRHATVLFEQAQANLRTVAEGIGLRIDKLEEAVRDGFADHERRIQVLEAADGED